MDVSIVMINYNTYDLTKNAIESIFTHTADLQYEIILVDNNSPDNSGDMLKNYFEDKIIYIQSGGNLGTSKAFNMGVREAKGKYILWLNTHILVSDNFVYNLFDYMEKDANCCICGGNLTNANNEPTHSYMLDLPSLKTVRKSNGLCHMIKNKLTKCDIKNQYNFTDKPLGVGYITGADMMIRKSVIDEIGGFDEDIFMYAEECEFTFRMKQRTHYKVISVPTATMQHLEGASFGKESAFNERRFRAMLNGNSIYFEKCYGKSTLIKYLRLLCRANLKLAVFNLILFRKSKAIANKKGRAIVKEKLREISVK